MLSHLIRMRLFLMPAVKCSRALRTVRSSLAFEEYSDSFLRKMPATSKSPDQNPKPCFDASVVMQTNSSSVVDSVPDTRASRTDLLDHEARCPVGFTHSLLPWLNSKARI